MASEDDVAVDRDRIRLGITAAAVDDVLFDAFGQRLVSTIFTQSNQYRVVLEVQPEYKRGPRAIDTAPGFFNGKPGSGIDRFQC